MISARRTTNFEAARRSFRRATSRGSQLSRCPTGLVRTTYLRGFSSQEKPGVKAGCWRSRTPTRKQPTGTRGGRGRLLISRLVDSVRAKPQADTLLLVVLHEFGEPFRFVVEDFDE